jgi:hypothetical protein
MQIRALLAASKLSQLPAKKYQAIKLNPGVMPGVIHPEPKSVPISMNTFKIKPHAVGFLTGAAFGIALIRPSIPAHALNHATNGSFETPSIPGSGASAFKDFSHLTLLLRDGRLLASK